VLHSHFAHSSSATLNTAQEQSALLGRILFVNALLGEDATERIMQQAARCARESSVATSGE
jgi:predicted GNAT family N-acyltransferase